MTNTPNYFKRAAITAVAGLSLLAGCTDSPDVRSHNDESLIIGTVEGSIELLDAYENGSLLGYLKGLSEKTSSD